MVAGREPCARRRIITTWRWSSRHSEPPLWPWWSRTRTDSPAGHCPAVERGWPLLDRWGRRRSCNTASCGNRAEVRADAARQQPG
ncbi:CGNR zinc finger domain-containing protein [Micromonospora sp. NPDC048905]|uniref:CGNR zinc finger domain-containing protein n=1 Tax=Micromonospora sp. NPDC048905 TaxID=3155494 RepID=UPI0033CC8606